MDRRTAELLLNTTAFDSPEEAYEQQLFKLRKEVLIGPVIPLLLYKKLEKLSKLEKAYSCFGNEEPSTEEFEMIKVEGSELSAQFMSYEENKRIVKRIVSKRLHAPTIKLGIEKLIQNLYEWTEIVAGIPLEHIEVDSISKELDSMNMYSILMKAEEKKLKLPDEYEKELLKEFRRIQLLRKTIRA